MSINRYRLAGLVAALALLATLVLPGSSAASPWAVGVAGASGSQLIASPRLIAGPRLVDGQPLAAPPAVSSQSLADPEAVGSRQVAVPGALGVTAAGTGVAGSGVAGSGVAGSGVAGSGVAGSGVTAAGPGGGAAVGGGSGSPGSGAARGGDGNALGAGVALPRVKAGSVLLADEGTGQVLFERAARQPRAMASTTKVMTALLSLERLDQRRTVVIGTEPTTVGEESLELRKGERLTVRQLLLGLLVKSANDAAVALADAVDGSEAAFVRRMNSRAAELGMNATHYVTAYGLDRPGHRTSARDLARVWEVAMRRADFRALISSRGGRLPGPPRLRKFTNTNQLLGSYAWAVGGKTGFTHDAGRCLVASASRGGRRLVAVALGSPDAFADVRALFEYGFTAFDWVRLAQRGQAVTLATNAGQARAYQATADVDALVRRDLLGELGLAPPTRLVPVPSGGTLTVWVQAAGQRLAPLRLGPPVPVQPAGSGAPRADVGAQTSGPGVQGAPSASGLGPAISPASGVSAALVPPGSAPAVIDPFLRRASP